MKINTMAVATRLIKAGIKTDHSCGGGLYLKVSGKGTGSWAYRYTKGGKRKRLGLGGWEFIDLDQARVLAANCREALANGLEPKSKQERITFFEEVANDYIAAQQGAGAFTEKHAQQWHSTLATYAYPIIGGLAPATVTTEHLLKILQPIWNEKQQTANRLRNRIELVLNAAKARKLREGENVAVWRGHLELLLGKPSIAVNHHPALQVNDVAAFYQELLSSNDTSALALQLIIITAARANEALNANWSEFDLVNKVWTIPASRMKARKEHRVPLSSAAMDLLKGLPRVDSGLLFEGRSIGKAMGGSALLAKLRRMDKNRLASKGIGWRDYQGNRITTHGLRSTFRDWASEKTTIDNAVIEKALAHSVGNSTERAYRRGDMLERRRELMELWSRFVCQNSEKVVNFASFA